jgi:hypothetical protein
MNKQFPYLQIIKNTHYKGLFYLMWTTKLGNKWNEGEFKQENFVTAEEIGQLNYGN